MDFSYMAFIPLLSSRVTDSLASKVPSCVTLSPLEVTRVDSPIIQIEVMLLPEDGIGTRKPFFKE